MSGKEYNTRASKRKRNNADESIKCSDRKDKSEEAESDSMENDAPKRIAHRDEPLNIICSWSECTENFTDFNDFRQHVADHTKATELNEEDEYECEFKDCSYAERNMETFNKHTAFHAYHERIKNVGQNVEERLNLPKCLLTEHYTLPTSYPEYICSWDDCNYNFYTYIHLINHLKKHVNGCVPGEKARCGWFRCTAVANSRTKLYEHVRVHTKERLVACPDCGNMFASNTKFIDHRKRQIPIEQQSYECAECSKVFGTKRLLREHMRTHAFPYKCNMCEMSFSKPCYVTSHIRYRHLDDRAYKCNLCEYKSVTKSTLAQHLLSHCAENLWHCEECDFNCRTDVALYRHVQIKHTKKGYLRPYACHMCEKRFHRGQFLTRHLILRHGLTWPPGHCRFRYKEQADGLFRLKIYESANEKVDDTPRISANSLRFKVKQDSPYDFTVYEANSESEDDEEVDDRKNIILEVDDVDNKGNVIKTEIIESKEIVTNDIS